MEFRILGPLEVVDGDTPVPIPPGKQRALLALLLLNAGRTVSRDRIVDELWGEEVPESASTIVRVLVSRLRKRLPDGIVRTRPPGYVAELGGHRLDLHRFEELHAGGRDALAGGRPSEAAAALREALAVWRGPALAEVREAFAQLESARLEELRVACLEERIEADLALARHAEVVAELDALVRHHPHRERLRGQLMLALYRSGRQAEALDSYRRFRALLDEELGIAPSPQLKELERRMLRQDPSLSPDGPAHAGAAAPASAGVRATPGDDPPGRSGELATLDEVLTAACAGERQVVFVTGGAGIGKTTIVETFAARTSAARRARVARGQCVQHRGAGEPYLPVLEALSRLCRQPEGAALVPVLAERAPTWVVQMPWLVPDAELAAIQRRLAGARPDRMLREMLEALEVVSAETPLVLVLEDMHWSDVSSLDLLEALASRRERARLLVVTTYRRDEAAARRHPVYDVHETLRARGLCAELAVGLLDEAALARLVEQRTAPARPPAGLARVLHERTRGQPLFARTLLDSWLEQGALDEGDASLERLAVGVPETVRQLIERVLDELEAGDRELVEAAGVVGSEFSAAAVAAACGRPDDDVERRLEALARRGTMVEPAGEELWHDGTLAARYRFGHDLEREVVYELMPAGRRARLHARVGERLEAAYGDRTAEVAATLAFHFTRARDPGKAMRYLGTAAARALRRSAAGEALAHLDEALALLERLPAGRERDEEELALLARRGLAQITLRGFAGRDAGETYARARAVCARLGDGPHVLPVLYGAWNDAIDGGRHEEALATGRELLRAAERHDTTLVPLARRTVAFPQFMLGRFASARAELERALADGAAVPDDRLLERSTVAPHVAAGSVLAWQLWFLGRPDAALARAAEAVRSAEGLEHPPSLVYALYGLAFVHQLRGDADAVRDRAGAAAGIARGYGSSVWEEWAAILALRSDAGAGGAERVERLRERIEAAAADGAVLMQTYFLALLGETQLEVGRRTDARATLTRALQLAQRHGERFYEAELHRLCGELALSGEQPDAGAAAVSFERALELARGQAAKGLELRAAVSAGRLLAAAGRDDEARELVGRVHGSFGEGLDTLDVREARLLLGSLDAAARAR